MSTIRIADISNGHDVLISTIQIVDIKNDIVAIGIVDINNVRTLLISTIGIVDICNVRTFLISTIIENFNCRYQ